MKKVTDIKFLLCNVKFNLIHVGSIELSLQKRQVDIACWYKGKYLNGSSGAMAGFFLQQSHIENIQATVLRVEC